MAVVKYGSLVTEIKGKLGGNIYQQGSYGPIVRTNQKIVRSKGFEAQAINLAYSQLSITWKALTNDQRQSWTDGADQFQVPDKFQTPITLAGYDVYVMLNYPLLAFGVPLNEICPGPDGGVPLYTMSGLCSVGTDTFTLSTNPDPITSDTGVIVEEYECGIVEDFKAWRNKRRVRKLLKSAESNPHDTYDEYDEQMHGILGGTSSVGKLIPVRWQSVDLHTGERSIWQITYVTIES